MSSIFITSTPNPILGADAAACGRGDQSQSHASRRTHGRTGSSSSGRSAKTRSGLHGKLAKVVVDLAERFVAQRVAGIGLDRLERQATRLIDLRAVGERRNVLDED